ncbi:MAG TPA: FAD-linked oxidase C-terminal domain-containing protein, partial [Polyangiaceae bacterium]|nr:FAD-linked oxidase C-terminal domain-containing protein [Polyangiaceae bacterium]
TDAGVAKYKAFAHDAAELVARYEGSLSGEHGDGQSRAELLPIMFGPELVQAFGEFKSIWDPDHKMNPGKVVDPNPIDADLRLGGDYDPVDPATHFKYPDDGGSFAHATLRCVGIGRCRRPDGKANPEQDVMCPSFMVTREERHTTRGRAHLLHEMLVQNKPTPIDGGWRDENVKEALDLCLSCKGCKGDCPVNVDIATYKAEFLSHYYEGRLRPRSAYAYGFVDRWARLASLAPGLVNLATQLPGVNVLAKVAAGMPLARRIPAFAPQTFRAWFDERPRKNAGAPRVVLWADTFNNYFHPEVARDAVEVLEASGYEVVVPRGHLCCGRPLYDYGFVPTAKRYLERVLAALAPHLEARTPIVVLEPSCASVFRDEAKGLFPERDDARRLGRQALLLSEFLAAPSTAWQPPRLERKAIAQGHCHHKSIMRFKDEQLVLEKMGLDVELLPSGCCGMAGSFGFEAGDKHRVSVAEGERVLLPAVRYADESTLVLANGFSCKTQIEQGTHRRALHLAEVIAMAMRHGPAGPDRRALPERRVVAMRNADVALSMLRAGAVALASVGAIWLSRRAPARRARRRLF